MPWRTRESRLVSLKKDYSKPAERSKSAKHTKIANVHIIFLNKMQHAKTCQASKEKESKSFIYIICIFIGSHTMLGSIWLKAGVPKMFWSSSCWALTPTQRKMFCPFSKRYTPPLDSLSSESLTATGRVMPSTSSFCCRESEIYRNRHSSITKSNGLILLCLCLTSGSRRG